MGPLCQEFWTHDEFKGKQPTERSGTQIPYDVTSCLNPLASGGLQSTSSGSRSAGMAAQRSLEHTLYREAWDEITAREFGGENTCWISLKPILPATYGIVGAIRYCRFGRPIDRWFAAGGDFKDAGHYRTVTRLLLIEARLAGFRIPFPRYLPRNDFSPAAEWIARRRSERKNVVVQGVVSPCVRTAAAANQHGLDIRGTVFLVGGEALTQAKREQFAAAGAEVYPNYYISEVGFIGHACRRLREGNRVHLNRDMAAVINRRRHAPMSDVEVNSLMFTPLLPFHPFVLINAEMDDAGVIEEGDCDCAYARVGMTGQIGDIFSYGKLTGQGTTLTGSDVLEILERALPSRFSGAPGDYQLVEQETGEQTQLSLRVSPRVGAPSPDEIASFFLTEVKRLFGGSLTRRDWLQSGGVKVLIEEPIMTASGKVLPLQLLGSGERSRDDSQT